MTMITPLLTTLINKALLRDPETAEKLFSYQGKKIAIHLIPTQIRFYVVIKHDHITLSLKEPASSSPVDAEISGTPLNLAALLLKKIHASNNTDTIDNLKDIHITGDALLIQELEKIVSQLDFDLMEKLSHFIGDSGAYVVSKSISGAIQSTQEIITQFYRDFKEYLEDETKLVICRTEAENFYEAVDALRLAVERVEAKTALIPWNHVESHGIV